MDMKTAFFSLNWPAVLTAALSAFAIGGLWYSPALFGKAWMRINNFTDEYLRQGNQIMIFGTSLLLSLIASFFLGMFIGPTADIMFGATAGCMAALGWVATFVGIHYLFERRSLALFAINAGYSIVALTVMGAILGAWR